MAFAATGERQRSKSGDRMSLARHLLELRKRLVIAAAAIIVGSVAGFLVSDIVVAALREPIAAVAGDSGHTAGLNYTVVTQAFDLKIQIALTVGVIVSSPVWLYQVWAFLVPALVRKERVYIVGFFGAAVPLFLGGCAAGWYVLPHVIHIMLGFVAPEDVSLLDAKYYYDFVLKLLLATGIAFVLPVFIVLLNFVGVLSAMTIIRGWRVAILAICLFSAIATPAADVLSMLLLALPMTVLYLAAALVAWVHDRRAVRRLQFA